MDKQNIIIIGGGPAGLTAGVYSARAGAKTLIIEKGAVGGKVNLTDSIENYLGFDEISGVDLASKMRKQAKLNGVEFLYDTVINVDVNNKKVVTVGEGAISYDALIIAGGTLNRKTGVSSEDKYVGLGVSYCAVCDGMFYKNKEVAVVGGGNTAFRDALYLKNICKKVYLIHRREGFRAEKALVDKLKQADNVQFVLNAVVSNIKGEGALQAVEITKTDGSKQEINVSGLFVALGIIPDTSYLVGKVDLDDNGYIIVDKNMHTSASSIYAAGDIIQKSLRQVITACADGAIAANDAVEGIENL